MPEIRCLELSGVRAEDWSIIGRFKRGDPSAFDDLVRRHRRVADLYACRLTNNPDEAADIVADTFYRVFRSLDKFKGESSFTSWLYRIEKNCFLDMRKRATSRRTVSLQVEKFESDGLVTIEIIDGHETPYQCLELKEQLAAVNRAMNHIPPNQKATLLMYHAESMSYEAIAAALNLPVGTVKSRINRARLRLRLHLRHRRSLFLTSVSEQLT